MSWVVGAAATGARNLGGGRVCCAGAALRQLGRPRHLALHTPTKMLEGVKNGLFK